jgi:DNA-binding transcriptional ArsR family regulator
MVNHETSLDLLFGALANPARRAILMHLDGEDGASVSALARPLEMKLPAMLKHLGVLEDAHLIRRVKEGRTMHVHLAPGAMAEANAWLRRYERHWSGGLDRLALHAEKKQAQAKAGKARP